MEAVVTDTLQVRILTAFAASAVGGCAVLHQVPSAPPPPVTVPDSFTGTSSATPVAQLARPWRRSFGDPELDLWGRIQGTRNAARSELEASRNDLATMYITVSSKVVDTWLQLVEQRAANALLEKQSKVNLTY